MAMSLKQYTRRTTNNVAVINKLWRNLLWSFDKCSIPASEASLFGLATIAFEGYMEELSTGLENITPQDKERFCEQILDAATAAAVLFKYICKTTVSSEDIVVQTKKGWIEKGIDSVFFDIIEDTQNLILGK